MTKTGLKVLAAFLLPLVIYVVVALVSAVFPANANWTSVSGGVPVWIASNGVHASIVVPLDHPLMDWRTFLPDTAFQRGWHSTTHAAFGWGEQGFYINTPTWKDLTVHTTLVALSGQGAAALHIDLLKPRWLLGQKKRILLSEEQYSLLVSLLKATFVLNAERQSESQPQPIPGVSYSPYDAFFQAKGTYHAFYTCNQWVAETLRKAGIRTPYWAPFVDAILWNLK